jgi:DNA-directed RNA polymerase subunit RPC12/RpoP
MKVRSIMIKKDLKCPQCGKTLLRLYGTAVRAVKCTCGYRLDLKAKESGKEGKGCILS